MGSGDWGSVAGRHRYRGLVSVWSRGGSAHGSWTTAWGVRIGGAMVLMWTALVLARYLDSLRFLPVIGFAAAGLWLARGTRMQDHYFPGDIVVMTCVTSVMGAIGGFAVMGDQAGFAGRMGSAGVAGLVAFDVGASVALYRRLNGLKAVGGGPSPCFCRACGRVTLRMMRPAGHRDASYGPGQVVRTDDWRWDWVCTRCEVELRSTSHSGS